MSFTLNGLGTFQTRIEIFPRTVSVFGACDVINDLDI